MAPTTIACPLSMLGYYVWSSGCVPLSITNNTHLTLVKSDLPWDMGAFVDCLEDGRTLRLDGAHWRGEVQPLWGTLFDQRIDWADGTSFVRRHRGCSSDSGPKSWPRTMSARQISNSTWRAKKK